MQGNCIVPKHNRFYCTWKFLLWMLCGKISNIRNTWKPHSAIRRKIKGELMGCNETQLIIKLVGDRKLEKNLWSDWNILLFGECHPLKIVFNITLLEDSVKVMLCGYFSPDWNKGPIVCKLTSSTKYPQRSRSFLCCGHTQLHQFSLHVLESQEYRWIWDNLVRQHILWSPRSCHLGREGEWLSSDLFPKGRNRCLKKFENN